MNSALRDAVASAGSLGAVTSGLFGDLGEAYLNSQYSQKQELAADEFGFEFTVGNGYSPYSMSNALAKLVPKNNQQQSKMSQMFSSHPDSALRAQKMKEKADAYVAAKKK
jgi:putative metalloprotease